MPHRIVSSAVMDQVPFSTSHATQWNSAPPGSARVAMQCALGLTRGAGLRSPPTYQAIPSELRQDSPWAPLMSQLHPQGPWGSPPTNRPVANRGWTSTSATFQAEQPANLEWMPSNQHQVNRHTGHLGAYNGTPGTWPSIARPFNLPPSRPCNLAPGTRNIGTAYTSNRAPSTLRSDPRLPDATTTLPPTTPEQRPAACSKTAAAGDSTSELCCSVCLEAYVTLHQQDTHAVVLTTCYHVFCQRCVEAVRHTRNQCPKCRRLMSTVYPYHHVFF